MVRYLLAKSWYFSFSGCFSACSTLRAEHCLYLASYFHGLCSTFVSFIMCAFLVTLLTVCSKSFEWWSQLHILLFISFKCAASFHFLTFQCQWIIIIIFVAHLSRGNGIVKPYIRSESPETTSSLITQTNVTLKWLNLSKFSLMWLEVK